MQGTKELNTGTLSGSSMDDECYSELVYVSPNSYTNINFDVRKGIQHFLRFYSHRDDMMLSEFYMNCNIDKIKLSLEKTVTMTYVYSKGKRVDIDKESLRSLKYIAREFKDDKDIESIYRSIYIIIKEVKLLDDELSKHNIKKKYVEEYKKFRGPRLIPLSSYDKHKIATYDNSAFKLTFKGDSNHLPSFNNGTVNGKIYGKIYGDIDEKTIYDAPDLSPFCSNIVDGDEDDGDEDDEDEDEDDEGDKLPEFTGDLNPNLTLAIPKLIRQVGYYKVKLMEESKANEKTAEKNDNDHSLYEEKEERKESKCQFFSKLPKINFSLGNFKIKTFIFTTISTTLFTSLFTAYSTSKGYIGK